MRNLLRKLLGIVKDNNNGFSFVELMCAITIFSLVVGTIGTVIVVSARTYRNGVSETSVQQEAQLVANNIGNLIKDASNVDFTDGVLSIVTNDNKKYKIEFEDLDSDGNGVLKYTQGTVGDDGSLVSDGTTSSQVLSGNIKGFTADTSDFAENRSIKVTMTVADKDTGREIPLTYTMNSRNEVAGEVTPEDVSKAPVLIFLEDMVCLVPGESYNIPVSVTGDISEDKLVATAYNSDSSKGVIEIGKVTKDYVEVSLKELNNTYASSYTIVLEAKDDDGNTVSNTATTIVYVREVTTVSPTYTVSLSSGVASREAAGAIYTFTAGVEGSNLSKFAGRTWDDKYAGRTESNPDVKAQAVYWSYELKIGDKTYTYDSSKENKYSDKNGAEQYITITDSKEDIVRPTLEIKLTQAMPSDMSLTVTATSKHAAGVNKGAIYDADGKNTGNTHYANVSGEVTVNKLDTKYEFVLEPNQSGTYALDNTIKQVNNYTVSYKIQNDDGTYSKYSPADGTNITYDGNAKKVTITVGNGEKGNGPSLDVDPYTFIVELKSGGTILAELTVHVRRVDYIKLVNTTKSDDKTYDYKVRFNTTDSDGQKDKLIKYLINKEGKISSDMVLDTKDEDFINSIKNSLAVDMSWVIKADTATKDVSSSEGVHVTMTTGIETVTVKNVEGWTNAGGVDSKSKDSTDYLEYTSTTKDGVTTKEIKRSTVSEGKIKYDNEEYTRSDFIKKFGNNGSSKLGGDDYTIVNLKPANVRVYIDSSKHILGYSMVQPPEIDIKFLKDTTTGVANGKMFVVRAEALHPYSEYNNGNKDYVTNRNDIISICTLNGKADVIDYTVKVDYDNIIVEAGKSVTIPFYVNAGKLRNLQIYLAELHYGTNTKISNVAVTDSSYQEILNRKDNNNLTEEQKKLLNDYDTNNIFYNIWFERDKYNIDWDDDFEIACTVTIDTGSSESGFDDQGYFELIFAPYLKDGSSPKDKYVGDDGKQILEVDLRKVLSVDLSVADANITNKAGSTLTLEARPTGYGTSGVEYYPKSQLEQDSGDTYYSPYTMKWSLVESDGTVHEFGDDFSKNYLDVVVPNDTAGYKIGTGTYYASGMYLYPTDNDLDSAGHKAIITIKLKQALPEGVRIRATSLHSLGKNTNGDFTNKSGNQYSSSSSGVYGEVIITSDNKKVEVNLIGLSSTEMEVSKGQVVTVPIYISVADVSGLSISLENCNGTWYKSMTIDGISFYSDAWISIPESVKSSNPNGVVECDVVIKVGDNQNTDFKFNIGINQYINWGNQVVRTDTITFKVK